MPDAFSDGLHALRPSENRAAAVGRHGFNFYTCPRFFARLPPCSCPPSLLPAACSKAV
ncbi:hypothetical protein [Kingella potus]|uniref:hypothetical protein n=1 Tax=Kingella potus TaxID=265175 RepID=UPI001FD23701|nr:hypothetical protein [Kingella potus]UOP00246.1 hypothetical protein LVJ84_09985 [Kingella potus]